MMESLLAWAAGLILAPLLPGITQRVKAIFAGRRGPPVIQPYLDIVKLLRKGAVYSRTTTYLFRAGPILGLAAVLAASLIVPLGAADAPVTFAGDLILVVYLLGLARFVTLLAALDTGSSFEGMGASREAWLSVLAEPALFLALAALARQGTAWSLSTLARSASPALWTDGMGVVTLAGAALFFVLLAENARIPVDDPNTHLELTMIHEVMVLDHGGIDLAFIHYGSALKLYIMSALFVGILVPIRTGAIWLDGLCAITAILLIAAAIGVVESSMARLRFRRIPQFLLTAIAFAAIAMIFSLGGK